MPSDDRAEYGDGIDRSWPDAINGWGKHPADFPGVTYLDPIDEEDFPASRRRIFVRGRRKSEGWTVNCSDVVSDDLSKNQFESIEKAKQKIVEWMEEHPCEQRTLVPDGGHSQGGIIPFVNRLSTVYAISRNAVIANSSASANTGSNIDPLSLSSRKKASPGVSDLAE